MSTRSVRLTLRLNPDDEARIRRAAALRGLAMAAFAREAVLHEAARVIAGESGATLSARESRRFLSALDRPFNPNDRLRKAMDAAARLRR